MRNKILSTAIATALSMGVHGVAQAELVPLEGQLLLTSPSLSDTVFATELFPTDTSFPTDELAPTNLVVTYRISGKVSKNFYATFTLSGGTWGNALDSGAMQLEKNDVIDANIAPALVDFGDDGDNSATFLIPLDTVEGASLDNSYTLVFSFKLDDEEGVLSSSNTISVGASFPYAPDIGKPAQVAKNDAIIVESRDGTRVTFELNSSTSKTFIDVAQDNKKFANGIDELTARLGYLTIEASGGVNQLNMEDYEFNGEGGNLEITSGVFSASDNLGENVFLDVVGGVEGAYDEGTDIPADTVDATTATWNLSKSQITDVLFGKRVGIVVKANGTTEIEEQEEAALAVLVLDYSSDSKPTQGRLEYIKRNGTRCKAYNVPYPGAKDNAFFRFTSKTDGLEGIIKGTLYKEDGTLVASDKGPDGKTFKDVSLLPDGETLAVNQTKVVSNQAIADLATEAWTGRATLVINSNLNSLEMLALMRNQAGVVGPLMNLSTGATGNACD